MPEPIHLRPPSAEDTIDEDENRGEATAHPFAPSNRVHARVGDSVLDAARDGLRRGLRPEDIIREVRARQPEVAESTVYRALAALEDLGVVEHVHLGHGPSTYHLTGQAHQHLVCRQCGRVVEVPDSEFADLSERLSAGYGFEIDPRHFAILGRCRHCRSRRRTPDAADAGAD